MVVLIPFGVLALLIALMPTKNHGELSRIYDVLLAATAGFCIGFGWP